MHYASVENISKSFGIRTLFREISFHVEEGDKIALVARNGMGKTTLLKIMAGLETCDEGTFWIHKDVRAILLQQDHVFDDGLSIWDNLLNMDHPVVRVVKEYEVLSEMGPPGEERLTDLVATLTEMNAWNFEHDLKQILGKLNLYHLHEPVSNLSGGQRKRVALAQALLEAQLHEGKSFLIMDEPTNHLDVEMIEWLEDFLSAHKCTLLLVTHDRYFMDSVCNEILELDEEKLYFYKGNYDYYLEQKSLRMEGQQSELMKDKNIFRKELEWMRKQPKARTTKSRSRQDAFSVLEAKVAAKKAVEEISLDSKMTRLGGKVVEMKKVYKSFGDKVILKGFDYVFKRGERIGIVGKNGTGKSTFLKIALGLMAPDSGKIQHGETVVFGNFAQEGLTYGEDKRAIEFVKEMAEFFPLSDGTKISAGQFMEKFGFSAQQQFTPLSRLSGGEKRRLHLLSILFRNPNFLVLDEPTNDLDLPTLRTLEEFLQNYQGCILIVSHDRYFMDRIVDHLFAFEGDGLIRDFPGNYSQYRMETRREETPKETAPPTPVKVRAKADQNQSSKVSFREKHEFEQLGKEIPELELKKATLEKQLQDESLSYEELEGASRQIGILVAQLDQKEMRWLELSEKIEGQPDR